MIQLSGGHCITLTIKVIDRNSTALKFFLHQVDENLLQQLQSGENIHIVLNPMEMQDQDIFARLNDPPQVPQTSTQQPGTSRSVLAGNSSLKSRSDNKTEVSTKTVKKSAPRGKTKNESDPDLGQLLSTGQSIDEEVLVVGNSQEHMDMTESWNQVILNLHLNFKLSPQICDWDA